MRRLGSILLLLIICMPYVDAQVLNVPRQWKMYRDGRWSLGLRGGGTLWLNDFDSHGVAGGGETFVRYSFTQTFSLGVIGSYVALQSRQQELFPGTPLQFDYMETKGLAADLVGWMYLGDGKFSPYLYAGLGAYRYTRRVSGGVAYPDTRDNMTIHIPVGFGADLMFSKYVGFNVDFGVRLMDDLTDYWQGDVERTPAVGRLDLYAVGRVGVVFAFGGADSDDDDGDGLTNEEERSWALDPLRADTDSDGLSDGEEVNSFRTNPKTVDTDGDGILDADEVLVYKTSPITVDTDGDGLSDGDEIVRFNTNPLHVDTDRDGLTDGEEVLKYGTNPRAADTGNDGVNDKDESTGHKTNPPKADPDGVEIRNRTDHPDANDDMHHEVVKPSPVKIGKAIVLEGITFAPGTIVIERGSVHVLQRALSVLREQPDIEVEIRGFTDSVGSYAANMQLSQRRAEAVRAWLVLRGIAPQRLTAKGYGPQFPIADNATPEGKAKNRRIEFFRKR
ncbi:MAG: hypothetical protein C4326_04820 [Ignavibacteria bacterium]